MFREHPFRSRGELLFGSLLPCRAGVRIRGCNAVQLRSATRHRDQDPGEVSSRQTPDFINDFGNTHFQANSCSPSAPSIPRSGPRALPQVSFPAPAPAPRRNAAHGDSPGWSGAQPWVAHPTRPRPNGADGEQTYPLPCALSGHGKRGVTRYPGFHPGLSPVAPLGHELRRFPTSQPKSSFGTTPQPFAEKNERSRKTRTPPKHPPPQRPHFFAPFRFFRPPHLAAPNPLSARGFTGSGMRWTARPHGPRRAPGSPPASTPRPRPRRSGDPTSPTRAPAHGSSSSR